MTRIEYEREIDLESNTARLNHRYYLRNKGVKIKNNRQLVKVNNTSKRKGRGTETKIKETHLDCLSYPLTRRGDSLKTIDN
jgi:hypothetical protein